MRSAASRVSSQPHSSRVSAAVATGERAVAASDTGVWLQVSELWQPVTPACAAPYSGDLATFSDSTLFSSAWPAYPSRGALQADLLARVGGRAREAQDVAAGAALFETPVPSPGAELTVATAMNETIGERWGPARQAAERAQLVADSNVTEAYADAIVSAMSGFEYLENNGAGPYSGRLANLYRSDFASPSCLCCSTGPLLPHRLALAALPVRFCLTVWPVLLCRSDFASPSCLDCCPLIVVCCVAPVPTDLHRLGGSQSGRLTLQRQDKITTHQIALRLIRDSTVIPNHLPQQSGRQTRYLRPVGASASQARITQQHAPRHSHHTPSLTALARHRQIVPGLKRSSRRPHATCLN